MVKTVQEINRELIERKNEFIILSDTAFHKTAENIAELIRKNIDKKPIILLSGPSGSGKTTTALTIENILDTTGNEAHTLSLDNYFKPLNENEKKLLAEDKLDLESPARVDKDLLNTQLEKMINCEAVELPKFNFKTAGRTNSGITLHRKHNEPVILEGIHSLNPDVIEIPEDETLKIYVSVRTRVQHNDTILHPHFIRLLRRMMRDNLFRGRSIDETIRMFRSVEVGAEKFIMPYKHRADVDIDTFIPYELSVYKPFLCEKLQKSERKDEVAKILDILSALESVDEQEIPKNSLIREFIGKGHFKY